MHEQMRRQQTNLTKIENYNLKSMTLQTLKPYISFDAPKDLVNKLKMYILEQIDTIKKLFF